MSAPTTTAPVTTAPRVRRRRAGARAGLVPALALPVLLVLAACSGGGTGTVGGPAGGPAASVEGSPGVVLTALPVVPPGEVVVLAAASTTDVMEQLGEEFEDSFAGTRVTVVPGPSSGLVQQALAGSPGDVLVSAAPGPVEELVDGGGVLAGPYVVALNSPVLAVPAGNPAGVTGLADLADEELVVSLCEPQVPCGGVTDELLGGAGVVAAPDSLERDVRAVLTRLQLGEADVGVVYRTDALVAGDAVEVVEVPGARQVSTAYPAVVLAQTTDRARAQAFVDRLRSPLAAPALTRAGFRLP